jgi:hypothetical protein
MRKLLWAALATIPLAAAGSLIYANSVRNTEPSAEAKAGTYTCPLTGEELPCPNCCPLNNSK